jgi:hypothetical protein
MGSSYVESKVREALIQVKGSRAMAQQLLMNWAATDEALLSGMAQPFLKAIAAAAVERAVRNGAPVSRSTPAAGPGAGPGGAGTGRLQGGRPASPLSKDALERVLSRMGEADEDGPAPRPAPAGGRTAQPDEAGHQNAMLAIAKAFKQNRGR